MPEAKKLVTVDAETFVSAVLKGDGPYLVVFSAPWCGYCKQLEPVVEQLLAAPGSEVRAVKVDIEQLPGMARHFKIQGVPVMIVMHKGKEKWRHAGFLPYARLSEALATAWPKP